MQSVRSAALYEQTNRATNTAWWRQHTHMLVGKLSRVKIGRGSRNQPMSAMHILKCFLGIQVDKWHKVQTDRHGVHAHRPPPPPPPPKKNNNKKKKQTNTHTQSPCIINWSRPVVHWQTSDGTYAYTLPVISVCTASNCWVAIYFI